MHSTGVRRLPSKYFLFPIIIESILFFFVAVSPWVIGNMPDWHEDMAWRIWAMSVLKLKYVSSNERIHVRDVRDDHINWPTASNVSEKPVCDEIEEWMASPSSTNAKWISIRGRFGCVLHEMTTDVWTNKIIDDANDSDRLRRQFLFKT